MKTFDAHIFCCTNERPPGSKRGCCAEKGAEAVRDYFKKRVKALGLPATRVNASGCLDACEQGPCLVIYPQGVWYRCQTTQDVDAIIESHLQRGVVVERLKL